MLTPVNPGGHQRSEGPKEVKCSRQLLSTSDAVNSVAKEVVNGPNSRAAKKMLKFAHKATQKPTEKSAGKTVMLAVVKFHEIARHTSPPKKHN
ncbi:MAG: hypothetical protein COT85_00705 [Chlamydiae bacterium CG10_big_fil_rev_8_21_14_0_10_42_34]|nr:MAG: hypothetical protein COT85_00705 [Chlamydiae bacterium CG10_big_fil_rev_8_21_14_0_10_42_34]